MWSLRRLGDLTHPGERPLKGWSFRVIGYDKNGKSIEGCFDDCAYMSIALHIRMLMLNQDTKYPAGATSVRIFDVGGNDVGPI
jgi:hypothetical protein